MRRMDQEDDDITLSERQEAFLSLIEEHGVADREAAEIIGVSRWAVWRWKKDPDFSPRYKEARKVRLEHLVKEAERRAMNGSDRLLEFLLCNYAPDKFSNKQKVEHGGVIPITVVTGVPTDDGSDLAG